MADEAASRLSNRAGRARVAGGVRGAGGRAQGPRAGEAPSRQGRGGCRRCGPRRRRARLSLAGSALPGSGPQVCPSGRGWGRTAPTVALLGGPGRREGCGPGGRARRWAEGPDPGRPCRLSSRPREALVPGGQSLRPGDYGAPGGVEVESPAHPPRGRSRPHRGWGRDEAGLPGPGPRALVHSGRSWKRARAPRMGTDPQPVSGSSDPERPWGWAASDRSDPAPAIRFFIIRRSS